MTIQAADMPSPTSTVPSGASGERERDAELAAFWADCIKALEAMDTQEKAK